MARISQKCVCLSRILVKPHGIDRKWWNLTRIFHEGLLDDGESSSEPVVASAAALNLTISLRRNKALPERRVVARPSLPIARTIGETGMPQMAGNRPPAPE
jgi:hypothetical protein